MRFILISAALAAIAVFGSCSSIVNTAYSEQVDTSVVNMTVADLDVAPEKVAATYSWNWNPFRKIQSQKDAALSLALNASGADIIVEPVYEVKHRGFLRGGSVTVTGYPALLVNFRPMTLNDADVVAVLNGKKVVYTPEVKTSAPSFLDKLKPKFQKEKKVKVKKEREKISRSFINVTGGLIIFDGNTENNMDLGIMYGHYGNRWGWYGKLSIASSFNYNNRVIPDLTFGAIKTIGPKTQAFLGAGVGGALYYDYYDYYNRDDRCKVGFGIPFEGGFQFNFGHCNVLAGFQYVLNTKENGQGNMKPFLGVGYTF